nr:MAG TPA: hypothetical protein [Caudoviricetes sp.]
MVLVLVTQVQVVGVQYLYLIQMYKNYLVVKRKQQIIEWS